MSLKKKTSIKDRFNGHALIGHAAIWGTAGTALYLIGAGFVEGAISTGMESTLGSFGTGAMAGGMAGVIGGSLTIAVMLDRESHVGDDMPTKVGKSVTHVSSWGLMVSVGCSAFWGTTATTFCGYMSDTTNPEIIELCDLQQNEDSKKDAGVSAVEQTNNKLREQGKSLRLSLG